MEKSKELLDAELEYTDSMIDDKKKNIQNLEDYKERIREKMRALGVTFTDELRPCPFCGEVPVILVSDDEGNIRPDSYEDDPFSGISYQIGHNYTDENGCPVAGFSGEAVGTRLYDTRDDLLNAWNKRA